MNNSTDWNLSHSKHLKNVTFPQSLLLTAASSFLSIVNPYRADMIAVLSETSITNLQLSYLYKRMMSSESGKYIMSSKPRILSSTVNLRRLSQLPNDTLGKKYSDFLQIHHFTPDSRAHVQFITNSEFAYIIQRYREIHDFVHLLSGIETNHLGELAVKQLEALQLKLPQTVLSALFGPLALSFEKKQQLLTQYSRWAYNCHRSIESKNQWLLSYDYERHFEEPIDTVRQDLGFIMAPQKNKKSIASAG